MGRSRAGTHGQGQVAPAGDAPATSPAAPAPWWRDPWVLVVALAVLPALFAARGTPLGEPFSDDIHFLHHSLLQAAPSWLDGGGSPLYWRPLSRQAYFGLLGPLMLACPLAVALLHATLLALGGVLLYRALRPRWPAPWAAFAGAFPLLMDPVREILMWPSGAQDLLAFVFGMAALHAISRGRRGRALIALLAALLSKEVALVLVPALPLWPAHAGAGGEPAARRDRLRTALAVLAVTVAWGFTHELVAHASGLLAAGDVTPAPPAAWPWWWRAAEGAREMFADTMSVRGRDGWIAWAPHAVAGATLAGASVGLARVGPPRVRLALPWLGWALVWGAITTAPIAAFLPFWGNYRTLLPAVAVGVALTALLRAAPPVWLLVVAALRMGTLLVSPGAPDLIGTDTASELDFEFPRAASLQRFTRDVRVALQTAYPELPPNARIVRRLWPRMTLFLTGDARAFQVWYRDTTLRVVEPGAIEADPTARFDAVLEFEPHTRPQVAVVRPEAFRRLLWAADSLRAGREAGALAVLDDIPRLQPDTACVLFRAAVWSARGGALMQLHRDEAAIDALRHALRLYPQELNSHRLLGELHRRGGRPTEAAAEWREHLRWYPADAETRRMLDALAGPVRRP